MNANIELQVPSSEQHYVTRQCLSVAMLVVLMLDIISNFDKEYRYIWKTPPFFIKRIYVCLRYIPLLGIIVIGLENYCNMWFEIIISSGFICLVLFDVTLLLRVHALYNRNREMGYFLVALFAVEIVRASDRLISTQRLQFEAHCDAHFSGPHNAVNIIWGLTLRKRSLGNRFRFPLIQRASKDGAWAFAGIAPIAAIIIPFTPRIVLLLSAEFVLISPMILFSITGCRIILNLQKNRDSPESCEEDIELLDVPPNGELTQPEQNPFCH
ncbi:hypothetical protein BDQ17DRAFT_1333711 [Cyathus striatus]|nr:hypothetical protein BDQ17DRAFT_1333711 [Cyathus striatus]